MPPHGDLQLGTRAVVTRTEAEQAGGIRIREAFGCSARPSERETRGGLVYFGDGEKRTQGEMCTLGERR